MNFRQAIENLDKSDSNERWVDIERFCEEEFSLNLPYGMDLDDAENQLKSYWVTSWVCTDTRVGIWATFLNGNLICISVQSARKNEIVTEWVSDQAFCAARQWAFELSHESKMDILDMDEEIDPWWFNHQDY